MAGPSLVPILLLAKSHNSLGTLFVVKSDKLVRNFILRTVKKQQRKSTFHSNLQAGLSTVIVISSECPKEEERTLLKLRASFLPSFFHSFDCSLIRSFIHLPIHSSICSFIHCGGPWCLLRVGMVMIHLCSYKPRHVHEWGCLCISEIRDSVNFFCEGWSVGYVFCVTTIQLCHCGLKAQQIIDYK